MAGSMRGCGAPGGPSRSADPWCPPVRGGPRTIGPQWWRTGRPHPRPASSAASPRACFPSVLDYDMQRFHPRFHPRFYECHVVFPSPSCHPNPLRARPVSRFSPPLAIGPPCDPGAQKANMARRHWLVHEGAELFVFLPRPKCTSYLHSILRPTSRHKGNRYGSVRRSRSHMPKVATEEACTQAIRQRPAGYMSLPEPAALLPSPPPSAGQDQTIIFHSPLET